MPATFRRRLVRAALGVLLFLGGTTYALLQVGALAMADCSQACRARGEPLVVGLLLVAGVAVAVGGAALSLGALYARGDD